SAISGWQSEQYTPSVPVRRSQIPPQRSQYFNSTSINSENSVCMITSAFMKNKYVERMGTAQQQQSPGAISWLSDRHRARFSYDDLSIYLVREEIRSSDLTTNSKRMRTEIAFFVARLQHAPVLHHDTDSTCETN